MSKHTADLIEACKALLDEIPSHIGKRNVRKHFSLMVREEAVRTAMAKVETA